MPELSSSDGLIELWDVYLRDNRIRELVTRETAESLQTAHKKYFDGVSAPPRLVRRLLKDVTEGDATAAAVR